MSAKVFRDASGKLDALRFGRVVFEFNKHDSWLPMYADRLLRLGRFQIWRDRPTPAVLVPAKDET